MKENNKRKRKKAKNGSLVLIGMRINFFNLIKEMAFQPVLSGFL